MSDVEKAQKLGKVLNTDVIVTGKLLARNYPRARQAKGKDQLAFGNGSVEIAARAIDVKTGKVIRYMDYMNEACAELVYSLKHTDYQAKKNAFFATEPQIAKMREERGF